MLSLRLLEVDCPFFILILHKRLCIIYGLDTEHLYFDTEEIFVHILPKGQVKKGTSILQKALQVNAKPTELIETAMQKLKVGNYQFLPAEDQESLPGRFHLNFVKYAVCLGGVH